MFGDELGQQTGNSLPPAVPDLNASDDVQTLEFKYTAEEKKAFMPAIQNLVHRMTIHTLEIMNFASDEAPPRYTFNPIYEKRANTLSPTLLELIKTNGPTVTATIAELENSRAAFTAQHDLVVDRITELTADFFKFWLDGETGPLTTWWRAQRYLRRQWGYVELIARSSLCRVLDGPVCADLAPVSMQWWTPSDASEAEALRETLQLTGSMAEEIIRMDISEVGQPFAEIWEELAMTDPAVLAKAKTFHPRERPIFPSATNNSLKSILKSVTGQLLPALCQQYIILRGGSWGLLPTYITPTQSGMMAMLVNQGWITVNRDGSGVVNSNEKLIMGQEFAKYLLHAERVMLNMLSMCRATYLMDCSIPAGGQTVPYVHYIEHKFLICSGQEITYKIRASMYITKDYLFLHSPVSIQNPSVVPWLRHSVSCPGVACLPIPFPDDDMWHSVEDRPWQTTSTPFERPELKCSAELLWEYKRGDVVHLGMQARLIVTFRACSMDKDRPIVLDTRRCEVGFEFLPLRPNQLLFEVKA